MISPVPQQQLTVASHAFMMKPPWGEGKLSDVKDVKRCETHASQMAIPAANTGKAHRLFTASGQASVRKSDTAEARLPRRPGE